MQRSPSAEATTTPAQVRQSSDRWLAELAAIKLSTETLRAKLTDLRWDAVA
ncbi:MAG TPA: hypothetical protein VGQ20_12555 [Acidimicrobiales bacterium]|jgi:hypothetical protein|nr:hypothetical protein [Acidimicrobiales bacterium]